MGCHLFIGSMILILFIFSALTKMVMQITSVAKNWYYNIMQTFFGPLDQKSQWQGTATNIGYPRNVALKLQKTIHKNNVSEIPLVNRPIKADAAPCGALAPLKNESPFTEKWNLIKTDIKNSH